MVTFWRGMPLAWLHSRQTSQMSLLIETHECYQHYITWNHDEQNITGVSQYKDVVLAVYDPFIKIRHAYLTFTGKLWDIYNCFEDIWPYPMLRADSRFWLVNNREIWSRISRLTSSAWDIKTKERHWWRHNGDSDRRPLSLPLRYDLVTLCLYDDLGQINVIAEIVKLRKRFRMSQILFEHGINSLPLVCFRGYGNLSTLSIAIQRLAFGRAWYCDAACG